MTIDPTATDTSASDGRPAAAPAECVWIWLKTSLLVPHLHEQRCVLPSGVSRVGDLLAAIGRDAKVRLVGDDGELDRHFDVRLNGKRIDFHPARLATPLAAGDRVVLQLIPIGGG